MDVQYKCGYCGFLLNSQCVDLLEHECFGHYIEEIHNLVSDENNVLTLVEKVPKRPIIVQSTNNANVAWEELLIKYVQDRPALYNFRLPILVRTNLKKQSLWLEIANLLEGKASVEEIKAKWKYLRDCYMKAKKKVTQYKPSRSASQQPVNPGFRFYNVMKFLDDSHEKQETISSISIEIPKTPLMSPDAGSTSKSSGSSMTSPSLLTPVFPKDVMTPSKKRKNSENVEKEILQALSAPAQTDGVDGILIKIGDSLRKFPRRERNRLELDILKLIFDRECELNIDKTNI